MPTDAARAVLGDAWGRIPQTREATESLGSFTRTRIERIIDFSVGFGCLVLGAQAFVAALTAESGVPEGWSTTLIVATFVPLAAMIIACAIGRAVVWFAGAFAVIYALILMVWPIATTQSTLPAHIEPWVFYLVNVGTAAAVLAFPLTLQIAWAVLIPLMFGIARLIQGGFAPPLRVNVVLDVSFTLILGGVLVTLGWLYRAIAVNVDETRARAVSSYSAAAAAAAAESERVAVAGLMHDSVLAALIAASRTESPRERHLAVQMAREALTRLANADSTAEEGSDAPVTVAGIANEIERVASDLGVVIRVRREDAAGTPAIPGRVAHALVLAAAQAVANSVQHADAKGLQVSLAREGETGLSVAVRDRGPGFDLGSIPPDRLGIRGSIIARMDAVGGQAVVEPGPAGTTVVLTWEASA
ncbi:MAG: ATP-binding protein [Microbacterium sp.]|uniref:ATP-binding protein n=1 Tax=Microbacterium sp. TaxID=51671 RepID=UPI0039E5A8AB